MTEELMPTRCVKAWERIDSLMRHSTDDAVRVIEQIADIAEEALSTRPLTGVTEAARKLAADGPAAADIIEQLVGALVKAQRRLWDLHGSSLGHVNNEMAVQRWCAEIDSALEAARKQA
jgi:hypothetical protein